MFMGRLNDWWYWIGQFGELGRVMGSGRNSSRETQGLRHLEWLISFTFFLRTSVRMSTRGANTGEAKRKSGGVIQEI